MQTGRDLWALRSKLSVPISKSPKPLKLSRCINKQLKVQSVCLKLTQTSGVFMQFGQNFLAG